MAKLCAPGRLRHTKIICQTRRKELKLCVPGRLRHQILSICEIEGGAQRLRHQILTICEIGGGAGGKPRGSGGSSSLLCAGNPKAVVTLQKQI